MLELRPICEHCATALPPASTDARICTFECTFCAACAEDLLEGACPNCSGNFAIRPIRPRSNWDGDDLVAAFPPVAAPFHRPVDLDQHRACVARSVDSGR